MPQMIGRYAVRRRIGNGGFATVWLAYDEQLDAPVAVKVLADNWTEDHQVRTRFLEEGRYLRRVDSPHVVTVYDAGELDDGRPYLVMSYADQGTLADRLEVASLTVAQSLEVVRQVGRGLQALHDRGILHRDVKPANVLFRSGDPASGEGEARAMLGDLGLGKALDASSRLTMIAGTPSFVAPEQAQGESPDARADQYSLAVLSYLLLTGRTPWTHASLSAAASPPPAPPLSTPERAFSADVEAVVARGLSPERADRWPSVTAYVEALGAALASTLGDPAGTILLPVDSALTQPGARPSPRPVTGPLPDPVPPRVRSWPRRLAVAVAALVAVAAGGVGGYVVQQRGEEADVTVDDDSGSVTVVVPPSWEGAVSTGTWVPPNAEDQRDYPAVSVGTSATWATTEGPAEGVFAGVLPGTELPDQLPQHPECGQASGPVTDSPTMGETVTVVYRECPAGVTVERVVQVNSSQLLWVQIRSADGPTANRVLDAVEVHGL